jgi:AcrR family transcriptional regulator
MEHGEADGISLRAFASALGVKAPSWYRYFPDKDALELAVADEALMAMLAELKVAAKITVPESRFRETAEAYLRLPAIDFRSTRIAPSTTLVPHVPTTSASSRSCLALPIVRRTFQLF